MAQVPHLQSSTTHSSFRPRDLEDHRVEKEGPRNREAGSLTSRSSQREVDTQVNEQGHKALARRSETSREESAKRWAPDPHASTAERDSHRSFHPRSGEERPTRLAAGVAASLAASLADRALMRMRADPLPPRCEEGREGGRERDSYRFDETPRFSRVEAGRAPFTRTESASQLPSSRYPAAPTARVSFEESKRINQAICRAESAAQIESICLRHRGGSARLIYPQPCIAWLK